MELWYFAMCIGWHLSENSERPKYKKGHVLLKSVASSLQGTCNYFTLTASIYNVRSTFLDAGPKLKSMP